MKEAIEPSDIRAGDLIREEYAEPWFTDGGIPRVATEYTATPELKTICMRKASGHFLLDRPAPPVELPTSIGHHFGWLEAPTSRVAGTPPGEWHFGDDAITASGFPEPIRRDQITNWIDGTLVPTEALDVLRVAIARYGVTGNFRVTDVETFLAAVDEANR